IACADGELIIVPINALHAFYNRTDKSARLLSVSTQLHQAFFDAAQEADRACAFAAMPHARAMAHQQDRATFRDALFSSNRPRGCTKHLNRNPTRPQPRRSKSCKNQPRTPMQQNGKSQQSNINPKATASTSTWALVRCVSRVPTPAEPIACW